jgi:hypothetical protein
MKQADQEVLTYLDYFRGGVPAGAIFDLHMRSLRELIKKRFKLRAHVSVQAEVCLIGGVAYFEAFCGDHFASILNLCPQLAVRLKENGRDVSIDATDLLAVGRQSPHIGSIIAERYDFGTPHNINSLYQHLLSITPFSKDEKRRYEAILNDRNLVVHHGGISTMKHLKQSRSSDRVHFDSIRITPTLFLEVAAFLEGIARKTVKASHLALVDYITQQKLPSPAVHAKAVEALAWID